MTVLPMARRDEPAETAAAIASGAPLPPFASATVVISIEATAVRLANASWPTVNCTS